MRTPKVSVIICMYKGEKTVHRMINCVLNQTYTNFEVILVDDGSPDRCGEIAEEYEKKDIRVRALHKQNGGLASARNAALEIAQGEYTIQFDQDDWVDLNCLEEMVKVADSENADMLICDNYREDNGKQFPSCQKPSSLDHYSVLKEMIMGRLSGYCWNKLIRRSCYEKYHVRFPIEFYGCEDQYGQCALLKNDIKISYLPKAFCHYVTTTESLSRYYDEHTYENDKIMRDMFVELLADTPYKDLAYQRKTSYMFGRAFMYGHNFFSSSSFKKEFAPYENIIFSIPRAKYFNRLYKMSFRGYYQFAWHIFNILFSIKQKMK